LSRQVLWGQVVSGIKTNAPGASGILGHFDPLSGVFTPLQQAPDVDLEALAAITPTTGKFVFSFTITIASTNLGSDAIACSATASVTDSSGRGATEIASVAATKSGSAATCTVTIPYSWTLASPTLDKVALAYSISAFNSATGSGGQPTRTSAQGLGAINVPPNGVPTPVAVKATI
jgi:hypothetical protein